MFLGDVIRVYRLSERKGHKMETENADIEKRILIGDLISDVLLVAILPLIVVIWLFGIIKGSPAFSLPVPEYGLAAFFFVAMPAMAFSTVYMWAIARRRAAVCKKAMRIQPDLITLCGYVLSSVSLVAVLQASWTTTAVNWTLAIFQIALLVLGIGFNVMICLWNYRCPENT